MTAPAPQTPTIPNETRERWSTCILRTCIFQAHLHGIIDTHQEGDTNLRVLPKAIHSVVFAKCQELIDRACQADVAGLPRAGIERRANSSLWDFLKTWRRGERP